MMPLHTTSSAQACAASTPSRWTPLARAATLVILSAMGTQAARAENLMDLYQAARQYDATYLSAKAQAESVEFQAAQAHALLRPSVNLQASVTRNRLDSSIPATTSPLLGTVNYDTLSTVGKVGIAARQPLLNLSNSAKVDQAEQALEVAQADLKQAEDDLAVRVAQAYFDVLSAQDVLNTAQANKKALAEQLAAAKRSFDVGNATITDTREAQARHDLATAQEIAATNDLRVKRIALDQLVGRTDVKPNPLRTPVTLDTLAPGQMDDWVSQSVNAPLVRKAEIGLKVAQLEVDKARANHLPTLDAVASAGRTQVDSNNSYTKSSSAPGNAGSIGLELNVPLYAGNAIQNKVREALRLQEKSGNDLDNARRSMSLATRQAFSGLQSGLAQVKAYEAAEASAKLALEATQLGYKVGVRINKDVLDAQTMLASTQKDLFKARYDVIMASLKLRQASGTLKADDLVELNKLVAQ
ncbi:TolC family outer membrane protein [Aquabacterium sp.]|uniref:TolC family outer membrane protein n=1 Tax=Aquabacterium sp. TaxID=1872578 RepID=UPI0035AD838A